MNNSLRLLVGIYKLGLGCGLWNKEEIIKWIDTVIENVDNPPYEIIEISLMSKAKIEDIEGKMHEICREIETELVVKLVIAVVSEKIKRNQSEIDKAIKTIARLLVHTGRFSKPEYYTLYAMDDCYELAKAGIHHDLDDVVDSFLEQLQPYNKYFYDFNRLYFNVIGSDWVK